MNDSSQFIGNRFSISDFIDSFGRRKFTWLIFFLVGICSMFEGFDFNIANYALPSMQAEWDLGPVATGALSSWSLVGLILGGVTAGVLSDRIGRKKVLIGALLFFAAFNFPIYFSPNWEFFAVFRVLGGIGLGACVPLVNVIFSEWMPSKNRAFFVNCGMAWMSFGFILAGIAGSSLCNSATAAAINTGTETWSQAATITLPFVSDRQIDFWRVGFFIGFIPVIYSLILLKFLPETPHFYASRGRVDMVIKQLQIFEKFNTGSDAISGTFASDQIILPQKKAKAQKVNPLLLFSPKYIKATIAIWIGYFCSCMINYGTLAWLPKLVGSLGYSYTLAMLVSVTAVFGCALTGVGSDKLGRRKNIILGMSFSFCSVTIAAFGFMFNVPYAFLVVVIMFLGLGINYGQTAIQPLMSEVYPTQIRSIGVAWSEAFGRFGGMLGPILLGIFFQIGTDAGLPQTTSMSTSFLFVLVPMAIAILLFAILIKKEYAGTKIDEVNSE